MAKISLPKNPKEIEKALKIFENTKSTIKRFDTIFDTVRKSKKGACTDQEQDILRTKLIFATSGLDAIIKQLIKDCLGKIVKKDMGSFNELKNYLQKILKSYKENEAGYLGYIAGLFCNEDTKGFMINNRREQLVSGSLQSYDGICRIGAAFGIKSDDIIKNLNKEKIKEIFDVRNQIVHEMDMDFNQTKKRRQRKVKEMEEYVQNMIELINNFISCTKKKLQEKGNIEKESSLLDNS